MYSNMGLRKFNCTSKDVVRSYILLMLTNTLAASLIFGINTLFLLDAGLSITETFIANAFFMFGSLIFEIPTGVVADLRGRRTSYIIGSVIVTFTTVAYFALWANGGSLALWSLVSLLLGLGFTFYSGATEAWLVDALKATKYKGNLESVFAKGQITSGIAMLVGTVAGGAIAQISSLGVPYILRALLLLINVAIAFRYMHDMGFTPDHKTKMRKQVKKIINSSLEHGIKNPPVRWIMLATPFSMGVSVFVFYALQPYLLELYGDPEAYAIAGVAAAIIGAAQIAGGMLVPKIRTLFARRTTYMLVFGGLSTSMLFAFAALNNFWLAVFAIVIWSAGFAASMPIIQAYLNDLIPSDQRATILSFNSLMTSAGGTINQPILGKVADVYSFSTAYFVGGLTATLALPFYYLARKENVKEDIIVK